MIVDRWFYRVFYYPIYCGLSWKNGRMSKNIKPKYPFWWSNMSGSVSTIQPEPAVAYFPRTSGIIHWEWGVTDHLGIPRYLPITLPFFFWNGGHFTTWGPWRHWGIEKLNKVESSIGLYIRIYSWLVVWNMTGLWPIQLGMECHHPKWLSLTPSFFGLGLNQQPDYY